MKVRIIENGRIEELVVVDNRGTDWTADFIGAVDYDISDDDHVMMTEADFDYWEEAIDLYDEAEELREELDDEETYQGILNGASDYDIIQSLRETIEVLKKELLVRKEVTASEFNEMADKASYYDELIYNMEDLPLMFTDPVEAIKKAYMGKDLETREKFNPYKEYFSFDADGDLISFGDAGIQMKYQQLLEDLNEI